MNLTRMGKSGVAASLVPRHSTGISFHASPSFLPANGPVAMRQSTPVSQASPLGDLRSGISGKRGASERAPHRRSEKIGSMRKGSGLTVYDAATAREKKRSRRSEERRVGKECRS